MGKHSAEFININTLLKRPAEYSLGFDIDLLSLFAFIKNTYKDAYFFESLLMPEHQDRYFTIGFNPVLTFQAIDGELKVNGSEKNIKLYTDQNAAFTVKTANAYRLLQSQFKDKLTFNSERHRGGIIGYASYEAANFFDLGLALEEHKEFGSFYYGLYVNGFIYDSLTGMLSFYSYESDFSDNDLADIKKMVADSASYIPETNLSSVKFLGNSETKEEFINSVIKTQKKIKEGYSFQSEVGFKSNYEIEGDKFAIYKKLREINPGPYMYYIKFDDIEILGASPEILISSHDRDLLTTPTAGTIKRGKTIEEDRAFARKLLQDPKEIAEHNMLVDLHRNDMAIIAEKGTVKIKNLMYLIKFSHVQHIVSDLSARQRLDKDGFDVLAAILPGGVVTGAPKIETIKIIDDNEPQPRGIYGGAVGRFSFNGDLDQCLPIRSIFCKGNACYAQTSAGVVYDSIPENEYEEVVNKLAAMQQTLKELGK